MADPTSDPMYEEKAAERGDDAPPILDGSPDLPQGSARFTEEQQRFIVTSLACFKKPKKVADDLKGLYGIEVKHLSRISYYDAGAPAASRDLSPEWRTLFRETRAQFKTDVENIAIAHQTFRLRELDDLLDHDIVRMAPTLRMQVLEQAAKECGGLFQHHSSGATPDEIAEYIEAKMGVVRDAVSAAIPEVSERKHVLSAIHEATKPKQGGAGGLEGGGGPEGL